MVTLMDYPLLLYIKKSIRNMKQLLNLIFIVKTQKTVNFVSLIFCCYINACTFSNTNTEGKDEILDQKNIGDSSVKLSLTRDPNHDMLVYSITKNGHIILSIPSSHFSEESPPPKMNLNTGSGIVVYPRDDGQGFVIDEWVGAAVSNSDPIYVTLHGNKAKISRYSVIELDAASKASEGIGSRNVFMGWLPSGDPKIKTVLDE